jgi:hypothetical protein
MGFFSKLSEKIWSDSLDKNGLARGTHSTCCERCSYRAKDPNRPYFVCALRKMYVGADQVCDDFERGPSRYQINY